MSKYISPNSRESIGAYDAITHEFFYVEGTSATGAINVNATASIAGSSIPITGATTAVGVAIVDGSGNQITSFGGGTQYVEGVTTSPATGTAFLGRYQASPSGTSTDGGLYAPLMDNFHQLKVVPVGTVTVSGTVAATQSGTWNINNVSGTVSLPTGAATSAKQPALGTAGTASADVITVQGIASMTALKVDGSAVNQPVSGTITANIGTTNGLALDTSVNGLLVAQASTTSGQLGPLVQTATTTSAPTYTTAKTNPLSTDTSGNLRTSVNNTVTVSGTVTANAGTNLNTSLLALESGGNLATLAGTVTSSILQGNVKQINGVTPLMGNGVTGTGSQRVTIASDNTAFSVNATLSAETTKVIGVTRTADGSGNLLTSTGNALDVNLKTSSITLPVSLTSTTITGTVAVTESGTWNVGSSSATGSSVPANAFYEGAIAKTSLPTAVSDGQLVGDMADKFGRQVVLMNSIRDLVNPITQLTLTSTTTETSLIAAAASTFNDIVSLVVINTSATATQVDFRDSTGGTIRLSIYVPAGETRGIALPTPLPQAAVNTAWTAKCGTSVASVIITGSYIANK